ncbi:MAG: efflux RND transporter permease subunit [Mesorhizobium sp.]|nr:efflux RND transporter permease subunit [Mesorhizobium sp.]
MKELESAAYDLTTFLRECAGVYNVMHDLRPGKPEIRLTAAEAAQSLGLTAGDIAGQLRPAFLGTVAATSQVGPESYEVDVVEAATDRNNIDDLRNFTVTAPCGAQVPLAAVANLEHGRGWARATRGRLPSKQMSTARSAMPRLSSRISRQANSGDLQSAIRGCDWNSKARQPSRRSP